MRLRLWSPATMTGMVAAGCLLAAVPLLAALLLGGAALERLTRHTESLVQEGVVLGRLGESLRDQLHDLERNAAQYLALGDAALLDVFFDRWGEAEETLRQIERRGLHATFAAQALTVREGLAEAGQAWAQALKNNEPLEPAIERIRALPPGAVAIIESARVAVDQQVEEIRRATAAARGVMLLSALALIPLTALLAFGFSVAVTRPLREMSRAIVALGHGRYDQPVAIAYPREMQQLGERLDWLRQRLADLEAEKDRFLRHVSHELKTPLTTLQEGSALLREGSLGPLAPPQKEVAQILAEAAIELGTLIENLLSYAQWRQEQAKPEKAWFDTRQLITEVLLAYRLLLSKRQLSVELGVHSPRLFGQRAQLRVALDNLLGNAVKHAPEGSVIEVHAGVRDGQCDLWVRDRGRGVPNPERGRIFEPFVRGTEAEESGVRGTGIGLSIVRETARAHDGTVEVEDAHPGARFRMVWPCPSADARA